MTENQVGVKRTVLHSIPGRGVCVHFVGIEVLCRPLHNGWMHAVLRVEKVVERGQLGLALAPLEHAGEQGPTHSFFFCHLQRNNGNIKNFYRISHNRLILLGSFN